MTVLHLLLPLLASSSSLTILKYPLQVRQPRTEIGLNVLLPFHVCCCVSMLTSLQLAC